MPLFILTPLLSKIEVVLLSAPFIVLKLLFKVLRNPLNTISFEFPRL